MKKFFPVLLFVALSACASGPSMQDSSSAMATVPADRGRLVIYRTGIMGTAIQPVVQVDGVDRGRCQPNGAFSVDVAPGERVVSTATEVARQTVVTVAPGQTAYVRCSIGVGFLVGQPRLEPVPQATGQRESATLSLTGTY